MPEKSLAALFYRSKTPFEGPTGPTPLRVGDRARALQKKKHLLLEKF
jgi:hypothetical protein